MLKVFVEIDQGVPRYVYTGCSQCSSVMGKSLCEIKNRGCCSYFPRFELTDIHRMSKSLEGLQTLNTIVKNPGTVIENYSIHAKGFFDKLGYDKYLKGEQTSEEISIKDRTIFFRACPFVKSGQGCTIPPRFRTCVCNFFICSEVLERPGFEEAFKPYIEERSRYARWLHRDNEELRHILYENKVNLLKDFDKSIKLLQEIPIIDYDFPQLEPVEMPDDWYKGA